MNDNENIDKDTNEKEINQEKDSTSQSPDKQENTALEEEAEPQTAIDDTSDDTTEEVSESTGATEDPIEETTLEEAALEDAALEEAVPEEEAPELPVPEKNERSGNTGRGIMTVGIMLSAISIILMMAISTCIIIGSISSLGKVAFIPVVTVPFYSDSDDSQIIADAMESVVVISIETETGTGSGSGIILSANGYIVTNYHVVEEAKAIYVQLYGSSSNVKAELVGYSEHDDIAVIKVNKAGLRPATFVSDCSTCKTGQRVYSIGAPKGTDYAYTVTSGIISAVNREVKIYDGTTLKKKMRMIQTDAAVNPGNSGGPLINAAGQVVGIVTLKLDGVDGIGFALPSDGVLPIVNEIIENGNADGIESTIASGRPLMGVTCVSVQKDVWYVNTDSGIAVVPQEYADANPDAVFKSDEEGVYVKSVSKGMDAYGKLYVGDVITQIDNVRVYTSEQLISMLNNLHGGDTVTLTVYRDGEYITVDITLKEAPIE